MLPVALIGRVEAAIAGVAHTQTPPASSTDQQALQQTETFSSRSGENLAIGPVRRQALTVGEELIPGDVAWMMVRNDDAPLILWPEAGLSADLAGRPNLLASLISSEHVSAGVRWVRQDAEHPRMGQAAPEQFAVPGASVRSTRKAQAELLEALHHGIGRALSFEQFKDHSNGTLHFLVGIKRNLVVVENKADRQSEMQLTLACLVELAAVEARADDVQFCLSESTLHAEYKAIVEVGWIVTPILVDDERAGDGAQLEQAMPVLVRSRQARGFQGEDRADLAESHVADQGLEVLATGHSRAGLAEIPVEGPDPFRAPAERLRLACQIVLSLGALLVEADLSRRRLTNVDVGLP